MKRVDAVKFQREMLAYVSAEVRSVIDGSETLSAMLREGRLLRVDKQYVFHMDEELSDASEDMEAALSGVLALEPDPRARLFAVASLMADEVSKMQEDPGLASVLALYALSRVRNLLDDADEEPVQGESVDGDDEGEPYFDSTDLDEEDGEADPSLDKTDDFHRLAKEDEE